MKNQIPSENRKLAIQVIPNQIKIQNQTTPEMNQESEIESSNNKLYSNLDNEAIKYIIIGNFLESDRFWSFNFRCFDSRNTRDAMESAHNQTFFTYSHVWHILHRKLSIVLVLDR